MPNIGAVRKPNPIPVVDLFAGPGGLGEGFSSLHDESGNRRYALRVSIEKEPVAHRTLMLRAFFRAFSRDRVPDCYYDYIRGDITREVLLSDKLVAEEASHAAEEAICAELGKTSADSVDAWIASALGKANEWVLIGGPPCQAYSLAGRSRRRKKDPEGFKNDEKHFLYKEYLRVIRKFAPSVFVMENVKGILSSTHSGSSIFERILSDLTQPGDGLTYQIRSFVVDGEDQKLRPKDFVIASELYGVPQARHRVILFGIRSDIALRAAESTEGKNRFALKLAREQVTVAQALSGLPPLRSRISKEADSHQAWLSAIGEAVTGLRTWRAPSRAKIEEAMRVACRDAKAHSAYGEAFASRKVVIDATHKHLKPWFHDPKIGGVIQHEARSHMRSDLHRYLFAACYASILDASPNLGSFPPRLLPDHANVDAEVVPFSDRFRVQLKDRPSTTVVSHISKDGHYYIHHDPSQCRSLTVREAARLQTFPDNYFFEGARTEQYHQVGNAVPPWLAKQIAEVVLNFLDATREI